MIDLYLMQMMKADTAKKQIQPKSINFEDELSKEIEALAEEMAEKTYKESDKGQFITPEEEKSKLKEKFMQALSGSDEINTIIEAIDTMNQEIGHLDPEKKERLTSDFTRASQLLIEESKEKEPDLNKTLQEVAMISDGAVDIIEEMAIKRYTEKDFIACKTLFAFLVILNENKFEYWQRLGISLYELNDFDNAVLAYDKAWVINNGDIPNRLFVAECYYKLNNKQLAEEICQTAKDLIESQQANEEWGEHLHALEESIATLA